MNDLELVGAPLPLTGRLLCGHCRGDIPEVTAVVHGQEVQCPKCLRFQWFEVHGDRAVVHPGLRSKRQPWGALDIVEEEDDEDESRYLR